MTIVYILPGENIRILRPKANIFSYSIDSSNYETISCHTVDFAKYECFLVLFRL